MSVLPTQHRHTPFTTGWILLVSMLIPCAITNVAYSQSDEFVFSDLPELPDSEDVVENTPTATSHPNQQTTATNDNAIEAAASAVGIADIQNIATSIEQGTTDPDVRYPLELADESGFKKVIYQESIDFDSLDEFYQDQTTDAAELNPDTPTPGDPLFSEQLATQSVALDVQEIQRATVFYRPQTISMTLNDVLARALAQSNQIAEFRFDALEFQQVAGQELGTFDPVAFVESSFGQGNEPVASNFEVNDVNQTNIRSQDLQIQSGVRRRTKTGGEFSVAKTFQFFDDDSGILQPPDQAISRLALNYSQELLRDSGRKVVLNRVLVANVLAQGQTANSLAKITNLLNDIAAAYWDYYIDRGKVLISQEQVQIARTVVNRIIGRAEYDGEKNLVIQAKSALLQREVELQQAIVQAKQAQDFLVRLIGDPQLMDPNLEIVTVEPLTLEQLPIHLQSEIQVAYQNRAEIQQSISNIKAARLTHHFTLNQLLPRLTFNMQASLAGLAGNREIGTAFRDQFDAPSYNVGLNIEVPFNNLSARFRDREAELAANRVVSEFRNTLDGVQLEVKLAARRLNYVGQTLTYLDQVIGNTYQELGIILDRTLIAPRRNDIPSVQLNLALDAQTRLNDAKLEFLDSVLEQQQSMIELKRATGTLLAGSDALPADVGPTNHYFHKLKRNLRLENKAYLPEIQKVQGQIFRQNSKFCGVPEVRNHFAEQECRQDVHTFQSSRKHLRPLSHPDRIEPATYTTQDYVQPSFTPDFTTNQPGSSFDAPASTTFLEHGPAPIMAPGYANRAPGSAPGSATNSAGTIAPNQSFDKTGSLWQSYKQRQPNDSASLHSDWTRK